MSKDKVEIDSDDAIVKLVSQAKHRPLPRSSKALFVLVVIAMIFTGGIAYGKHSATASTGTGLSLSALGGGGGFGGGFGSGRIRGNGGANATGAPGTFSGGVTGMASSGAAATTSADVAGTVVSVTPTSVVVTTLAGSNQTFPILPTTRVRASTKVALTSIKAGDIVTIKPDSTDSAKTIMVVK